MNPDWTEYYRACLAYPSVVRRVESLLNESLPAVVSVRETANALAGQGIAYDQVAQVLAALVSTGALSSGANGALALDAGAYSRTQVDRRTALEALAWAGTEPTKRGECELLIAAPVDALTDVDESYQRHFSDLRTTLRALVAEASQRILLAAPYWDVEVASDFAEILRRRLDAGVSVAILARRPQAGSTSEHALAAIHGKLRISSGCQIRILERPSDRDRFGSSTFHFKAACTDGTHVYLGSANFNTAGLASRWELGVRLEGDRARTVSELLETLFAAARPL